MWAITIRIEAMQFNFFRTEQSDLSQSAVCGAPSVNCHGSSYQTNYIRNAREAWSWFCRWSWMGYAAPSIILVLWQKVLHYEIYLLGFKLTFQICNPLIVPNSKCFKMKCLISVSMRTRRTRLLRRGQEVLCLLLAGLLHHFIEDALGVLQEGVGRIVGLDLPRVEHLDTGRPLTSKAAP